MSAGAHLFHIVMCFLTGFFWLIIYIPCAVLCSSSKNRKQERRDKEELELLREIRDQGKWKNYRD